LTLAGNPLRRLVGVFGQIRAAGSVLRLRFVEDLHQSEIAERVGVSQMHVSRLLRRTLEELRTSTLGWTT
jgi:RNA polymerase sigma-B factor